MAKHVSIVQLKRFRDRVWLSEENGGILLIMWSAHNMRQPSERNPCATPDNDVVYSTTGFKVIAKIGFGSHRWNLRRRQMVG